MTLIQFVKLYYNWLLSQSCMWQKDNNAEIFMFVGLGLEKSISFAWIISWAVIITRLSTNTDIFDHMSVCLCVQIEHFIQSWESWNVKESEASILTVNFSYEDQSKLRPPLLLRPFVSVPKCIFQCKWVSLMRPVHYYV